MARDAKLMSAARSALVSRRQSRERELRRRENEVFSKSPEARRLSEEIERTMRELFALALKPGAQAWEIEDVQARNLALQERLWREIVTAGFPDGYLDDEPYCARCGDTGQVGAEPCSCLLLLYKEEQKKALSSLFKLGRESFDTFRLDYYEGDARLAMEGVFKYCKRYADEFSKSSPNLLMTGAPGLGKTFLSASVARVVAERECSVVYDTFSAIFARFEEEKFSRDLDMQDTREQTRRYRECDLLIADDLGNEMTTSFTVSALYELINTRLISGKKTIISTNLRPEELARRYSPQIASRLEGEYTVLRFYGSDIRLKKNETF